jgi:ATP-binding cassette subfamily B protein
MDVGSRQDHHRRTDIRSFRQEELYSLFSVVFQDVYLFNDTILTTSAWPNRAKRTRRSGSREKSVLPRLHHGARTAIRDLRRVEQGARLSGGERQRIAIARAILKDAPLLILDEATASIDPENELLIQQGLTNLTRGKTLLVIAHRLSTIQKADQILVLENGTIAERGRHDDLLAREGIYHNLWTQQNELRSWTIT